MKQNPGNQPDIHRNKSKSRSGWIMLGIVFAIYILTWFLNQKGAGVALSYSLKTLKMVFPIIVVVFLLMTLMNTFIHPKTIVKHLGKESGIKGWFIALAGGIVSHGSTMIWYPLLADLRNHGAKNGLIVAFIYARAIKLPWLPLMAHYFGITFTILLSVYIIFGAWLQGLISDKLMSIK